MKATELKIALEKLPVLEGYQWETVDPEAMAKPDDIVWCCDQTWNLVSGCLGFQYGRTAAKSLGLVMRKAQLDTAGAGKDGDAEWLRVEAAFQDRASGAMRCHAIAARIERDKARIAELEVLQVDWTPREYEVLAELAMAKDMPRGAVLRQALQLYHRDHLSSTARYGAESPEAL